MEDHHMDESNFEGQIKALRWRVESVAQQNRRLRVGLLALSLLAAFPFLVAAGGGQRSRPADVVRAQRFDVTGGPGNDNDVFASLRGEFVGRERGLAIYGRDEKLLAFLTDFPKPKMLVFDENQSYRTEIYGGTVTVEKGDTSLASISHNGDSGHVTIWDTASGIGSWAYLGATEKGGFLTISNKRGMRRVHLEADTYGGVARIFNNDGKPAGHLGTFENGGGLGISDKLGKTVAELSSTVNGGYLAVGGRSGPVIAVRADSNGGDVVVGNNAGTWVAALGVNPRGDADLVIMNRQGKRVGWLTTLQDDSSGGFQLLNPSSGNVVFKAPEDIDWRVAATSAHQSFLWHMGYGRAA
jgi:hypothetical protein